MGDICVHYEHRMCTVDGRPGYFHCWEQYYDVLSPGLTVGSHPGGQFARVFGIVEFNDGVERVDIHKIKFADDDNAFLSVLEKHYGNDTGV